MPSFKVRKGGAGGDVKGSSRVEPSGALKAPNPKFKKPQASAASNIRCAY